MKQISVTIVEDNHDIRAGLKSIINSSDELVCEYDYANAEDAIAALSRQCTDVVLMDIDLPGMNGIEAIEKLKQICSESQYMMLTVYEDDDKIFRSLQAGAVGYMLKKSTALQILQAVQDLHNGGSPMSPGIARKVLNAFNVQPHKTEPDYQDLSEREKEIVNSMALGYRYKEIAEKLFISPETVRTHIRNIYQKLQVRSRTDALNKIFRK